MEKKCLWLEFEDAKREVEELKQEKKRCKEAMDVRLMLFDSLCSAGRANHSLMFCRMNAETKLRLLKPFLNMS